MRTEAEVLAHYKNTKAMAHGLPDGAEQAFAIGLLCGLEYVLGIKAQYHDAKAQAADQIVRNSPELSARVAAMNHGGTDGRTGTEAPGGRDERTVETGPTGQFDQGG